VDKRVEQFGDAVRSASTAEVVQGYELAGANRGVGSGDLESYPLFETKML
jgi:hypothetical protein